MWSALKFSVGEGLGGGGPYTTRKVETRRQRVEWSGRRWPWNQRDSGLNGPYDLADLVASTNC